VTASSPGRALWQVDELTTKFSLERITKSPAVFDKVKLSWMNGQHLKALPEEQVGYSWLQRAGPAPQGTT
jgi:glutamyl-tRNA synthetase